MSLATSEQCSLLSPGTKSLYEMSTIAKSKEYKYIIKKLRWIIKNIPHGHPVGMAAPQIGINRRVFIAQNTAYINPVIKEYKGIPLPSLEGCYSLKAFDYRTVKRYREIVVEYTDEKGNWTRATLTGFAAVVVQHELDHLNGIVIDKKETA